MRSWLLACDAACLSSAFECHSGCSQQSMASLLSTTSRRDWFSQILRSYAKTCCVALHEVEAIMALLNGNSCDRRQESGGHVTREQGAAPHPSTPPRWTLCRSVHLPPARTVQKWRQLSFQPCPVCSTEVIGELCFTSLFTSLLHPHCHASYHRTHCAWIIA